PKDESQKSIQALTWPNSCIQPSLGADTIQKSEVFLANHDANKTEDCLYLNVWSPALKSDAKRPVLVWIHGGGLYFGTTSLELYNGVTLASRTDAVVVSMNYR